MNPRHGMFYPSAEEAAAAWTGDRTLLNRSAGESLYRMILPDTRAMFEDVIALENGVDVHIRAAMRGRLWVAAAGMARGGGKFEVLQPVANRRTSIDFPVAPHHLALYLVDAGSVCYDQIQEYAYRSIPGSSLYSSEHRIAASLQADLDEARRRGEGPQTEFKAWMCPDRSDKKTEELIRTAVAFANTRGGSIYVGVNDTLDVVGIQPNLGKHYGKIGAGDSAAMRRAYENTLRLWITEGVRPTIEPEFDWIEQAGLAVLRIHIPQGTHRPYHLAQRSDMYVRRGSSNARPEPGEIVEQRPASAVATPWE